MRNLTTTTDLTENEINILSLTENLFGWLEKSHKEFNEEMSLKDYEINGEEDFKEFVIKALDIYIKENNL